MLAEPLPRLTQASLITVATLDRALDTVRAQGRAAEREEAIIGEASVAAPIFDRRGLVAGAVGVAGAVERLYSKREPKPDLAIQV